MEDLVLTLKSQLTEAVRNHRRLLLEKFPNESFYGYALFTDDDVTSIGAVASSESSIGAAPDDPFYMMKRLGPHEWDTFGDFGAFQHVNQTIKALHDHDELDYLTRRQTVVDAAFDVLKELEGRGFFGPRDDKRFAAVWVTDSDCPIMDQSAQELNSAEVYDAYTAEYA